MNYEALRALIESREDCEALIEATNYAAITDILNARTEVGTRFVPCEELLNFSLKAGVWWPVVDAGNNPETPNSPYPVRDACRTIVEAVNSERYRIIDVANPENMQLLSLLVAVGMLTANHFTDIVALASVPVSPFEAEFGAGVVVSVYDISRAFRGYD